MSGLLLSRWRRLLDSPPPEAVAARTLLTARAKVKADECAGVPAELDCVVAGSGFMSLYYHYTLVVSHAGERPDNKPPSRSRCATCSSSSSSSASVCRRRESRPCSRLSSGAQAPFQLLLAGEDNTLDCYLAYAVLSEAEGASMVRAAWNSDTLWRDLGDYLIAEKYAPVLGRLDDRMFVSVTHWFAGWKGVRNRVYSRFSEDPTLAREAFYATGTALTRCGGYWSSDGGVTNMCDKPQFADAPRPQLVVNPVKSGLPMRMAVQYTLAEAVGAIERGQDDAARLFGTAQPPSMPALKLVPAPQS